MGKAKHLPPAKPGGFPVRTIESIADRVRSTFGFRVGDDIRNLVESLGCKIQVVAPEKRRLDIHGTLEVRGLHDWRVYLPQHTGPLQDRFTLAHELGHFVLHSSMGQKPIKAFRTFSSSSLPDPAEIEADVFALALLMPRQQVQKAARQYGERADVIAAHFSVPHSVALKRLKSLGVGTKAAK